LYLVGKYKSKPFDIIVKEKNVEVTLDIIDIIKQKDTVSCISSDQTYNLRTNHGAGSYL